MSNLDKEKYIAILKSQGVDAAITALHKDKDLQEFTTFEGAAGYQRGMWEGLAEYREFSRELWDMALELNNPNKQSG